MMLSMGLLIMKCFKCWHDNLFIFVYLFLFICTYWHYMTSEVMLFVQFNQNHILDSDEKDRQIKLEQQKQYMLVI